MQLAIFLIGVVAVIVYTKWFVSDDKMTKRAREEEDEKDGDATSDTAQPNRVVKRLRTLETSLNIIRKALLDDGDNVGFADTATLDQLVAMRRDIDSLSSKLQTAHGSDANIERIAESIRNVLEDSQQKIREQVERNSKELSEHPAQLVALRKELNDCSKKLSELVLLVEKDESKMKTMETSVQRLDEAREAHEKCLEGHGKRLDAVDASVQRLDAVREVHEKRLDSIDEAHAKRLDSVRETHGKRLDAIDAVREAHEKRLDIVSSLDASVKRLDEAREAHEKRLDVVSSLDASVKRLDEAREAQEKRLDSVSSLDTSVKRLDGAREAHEKRLDAVSSLEASVKRLDEREKLAVDALNTRVDGTDVKLADLEGQIESVEHSFTEYKVQVDNRHASLTKGAEELGLKSSACDKRAEAHEARSAALEKEVSMLRTRADTCERLTTDLESRADKQENKYLGLQKDIHELDKRSSTVEKLSEDTHKTVSKYEERYAALEKNLREVDVDCKARRAICENTAGDISTRVREYAQQVSILEVLTAEMKTRAFESDKKVEDLGARVQQHSEQLVGMDAESKTRSAEHDKKTEELSTRTQHHSELLASIEAQTNGLRAELDASSRRITSTETEARDWRHGVERQLVKIEPVPEQVATLQRTSAFLSAKVEEHEKRFEKNSEALLENLAEKEQTGQQLERRVGAVEQTTESLHKASELHSEQLAKLNTSHETDAPQIKRIGDIAKETERLNHAVTELQRHSAEIRTTITELCSDKHDELSSQVAQLVSSREMDLTNLRNELASRLDESATTLRTIVDTIRKECEKINDLRTDIDGKSSKQELQKVHEELETRIASIAGQVDLAKKTVESSAAQRNELRALRADLSAQTASLVGLRGELAELNLPQIQRTTELTRQWRVKTEHLITKFVGGGGTTTAGSAGQTDDPVPAELTARDEIRDENIVSEAVRKISDDELPKLRKALESSMKEMGVAQSESMMRELELLRKERSVEINSALEHQNAARDLSRENALKSLREMEQKIEQTLRKTRDASRAATEGLSTKLDAALADLTARRDASRGKELEKWRSLVTETTKGETQKVETKLKDVENELQKQSRNENELRECIQSTQRELEKQKQECQQRMELEQKKTGESERKVYAAIESAVKGVTASRKEDVRGLDARIKEASSSCAEQRARLREAVERARDEALLKLAKSRDDSRAKELSLLRIRMEKLGVENLEAALGKLKTNGDAVVAKEIEKLRGEVFKRVEADISKMRADREEALERNAQKYRSEQEKRLDVSLTKLAEERDSSRNALVQSLQSSLKKHVQEELARFQTKREEALAHTLELIREEVKKTTSAKIEKWNSDRDTSRDKTFQQLSAEMKNLETEQRKVAAECVAARKQLHADIQKETKTAYASLATERDASRTQSLNQLRNDLLQLNEATLGKAISDLKSDLRKEISEKSMSRNQQDLDQTMVNRSILTKLRAQIDTQKQVTTEWLTRIEGDGSRFLLLDQINQLAGGKTFEEYLQERVDDFLNSRHLLPESKNKEVEDLQNLRARVDELESARKRVSELESLLDVSSASNVLKMAFYNVERGKLDDNNNLIVNLLCRDCDMAVLCDMWVPEHRLDVDMRHVGATDTMLPYLPRQRVHYLAMRTIEAKHDPEAGAGFIMSGLYLNPNLNLAITKKPYSVPEKPNGDTCALVVEATLFAKYNVSFVAVFPTKPNASRNSCEALVNYVRGVKNRVLLVLGDFGTDMQNFQKVCKNTPGLRSEFAFCVNKPLFTSFSDSANFRHHVHILTNGTVLSFDAKQHSERTMSVHVNVSLVYSEQLHQHKKYGADAAKFHNKRIV